VTRSFDGTQDVQLNTIATNQLILAQVPTTFSTQPMQPADMMVFSSGTSASAVLKKISRQDFLAELYDNRPNIYTGNPDTVYADIIPAGTIFLWPNNVPPANFVKCDGSNYTQADPRYSRLHDKIGTTYGFQTAYNVDFNVPNIPPVVTSFVSKNYARVSPYLSTTGTGATFDVGIVNGRYHITLASVGTNYTATTLCQIAGTQVGGATPANDISITVLSTATSGAISSYNYIGSPALNGASQLTYIIKL
jgi:microcystin-dependent protein